MDRISPTDRFVFRSYAPEIEEGRKLQRQYADLYGFDIKDIQEQEKYAVKNGQPVDVYEGSWDMPEGAVADFNIEERPIKTLYPSSGDTMLLRKAYYDTLIKNPDLVKYIYGK